MQVDLALRRAPDISLELKQFDIQQANVTSCELRQIELQLQTLQAQLRRGPCSPGRAASRCPGMPGVCRARHVKSGESELPGPGTAFDRFDGDLSTDQSTEFAGDPIAGQIRPPGERRKRSHDQRGTQYQGQNERPHHSPRCAAHVVSHP